MKHISSWSNPVATHPGPSLPLATGQLCARRLIARLGPRCQMIEVAGSIRRERPTVGDVDLVAIPTHANVLDMFGTVIEVKNLLADEIRNWCRSEGWVLDKDGPNYMVWQAKGIQVDIWFATPTTWASVLLCRTGSARHNIWLCDLAKAKGGHWNPHHGLTLHGRPIYAPDEAAIYAALGVAFIPPVERDYPRFLRYIP